MSIHVCLRILTKVISLSLDLGIGQLDKVHSRPNFSDHSLLAVFFLLLKSILFSISAYSRFHSSNPPCVRAFVRSFVRSFQLFDPLACFDFLLFVFLLSLLTIPPCRDFRGSPNSIHCRQHVYISMLKSYFAIPMDNIRI